MLVWALVTVMLWVSPLVYALSDQPQEPQSGGQKPPLLKFNGQTQATGAADSNAADPPAPQLVYPEDVHDFGAVSRGAKLVHIFKIHNAGETPLKIFNAKGT